MSNWSQQGMIATWSEKDGLVVSSTIDGQNEHTYTGRGAVSEGLRWVLMHAYVAGALSKHAAAYYIDQIEKAIDHTAFMKSLEEADRANEKTDREGDFQRSSQEQ